MAQPAESGHWYQKDGTPAYTVKGKNGKERNTTLRDARKMDLIPSVTGIIAMAYRHGLENWKQEQLILACLTMPQNEGESEDKYIRRIKEDAKAQATKAAERGTQIHAWVQSGFEEEFIPNEGLDYYVNALDALETLCSVHDWIVEKPFAAEIDGCWYGGKVDIQADEYVIDIKTTEKDLDNIKTWDEHAMQLAAYDVQGNRECGILYINSNTAEAKLIMLPAKELKHGHDCFKALLAYWYAKNKLGRE